MMKKYIHTYENDRYEGVTSYLVPTATVTCDQAGQSSISSFNRNRLVKIDRHPQTLKITRLRF